MPRPPKPGLFDKVNGIVRFVENPCLAPWSLYFETAVPAAGRAVVSLLDFGFTDVVRGALRPKGLRSGRHGRRGARGGRRGGGIPELGELIGKPIGESVGAQSRSVSQGVKNLWIFDGVIQRLLWYWLVVDVSVSFFYEWASAIQRSEFCQKQGKGYMHSRTNDDDTLFAVANAWSSLHSGIEVARSGNGFASFGGHFNGGEPFTAVESLAYVEGAIPGGRLELLTTVVGNAVNINPGGNVDSAGKSELVQDWDSSGPAVQVMFRTNGGSFVGRTDSFTFGK